MEKGSESEAFNFGPYKIDRSEVFYTAPLSFLTDNLRPILPEVLVILRREVKRFFYLTPEKTSYIWLTAKEVGSRLERHHEASSMTFNIQDEPQAGQAVPHVQVDIILEGGGF